MADELGSLRDQLLLRELNFCTNKFMREGYPTSILCANQRSDLTRPVGIDRGKVSFSCNCMITILYFPYLLRSVFPSSAPESHHTAVTNISSGCLQSKVS
jgi:hypothetical protein